MSSVPLKKVQQMAGFLNYYLAFAGRPYFVVYFFLKNFLNFHQHKHWWINLINTLAKYKEIMFLAPDNKETEVLHVDASQQAIG